MMQSSYHLQAMGIQQWVRRDLGVAVEGSRSEDFFHCHLERSTGAVAPLLLIAGSLSPSEQQLLERMLGSVDLSAASLYQMVVVEPVLLSQPNFTAWLGEQISELSPQGTLQLGGAALADEGVITIPHPAQLLAHPQEKRVAWQGLKQLHQLLSQG